MKVLDYNSGHRARVKNKFLYSKPDSFADYEILEMILFYSIPRKDVKPLAKNLLKRFKNIGNFINASNEALEGIDGIGESTQVLLKLIKEISNRLNKEQLMDEPLIESTQKLVDHLRTNIGYTPTEHIEILYLNNKNYLIEQETFDYGTVNSVAIYPREIVKRALYHEATSVILAHNHPSGITQPSQSDLTLTKAVKKALDAVNINLIDHIIVSKSSHFSFKSRALI